MRTLADADPLATALADKARAGGPGRAVGTMVAAGDGWRVVDMVCTSGPEDRPFEERQPSATISLVVSGTFAYRSVRGPTLLAPGAWLLGNPGDAFECSHEHGAGDRCLSFQLAPALLDALAHDVGAGPAFTTDRLPPARTLAPVSTRALLALAGLESFEEVALALAGTALRQAACPRRGHRTRAADPPGVVRALRRMAAHATDPLTLADLARDAGLTRWSFLRAFTRATGVTPHQWLLRARLRDAARRLACTDAPVTDVALDVGFQDLSNFVRTFRAEFGVSPRAYRSRRR